MATSRPLLATTMVVNQKERKTKDISYVMVDMGMKKKQAKVIKVSNDRDLDQAVILWFRRKRSKGIPKSGSLLCEKVLKLSKILHSEGLKSKVSEG